MSSKKAPAPAKKAPAPAPAKSAPAPAPAKSVNDKAQKIFKVKDEELEKFLNTKLEELQPINQLQSGISLQNIKLFTLNAESDDNILLAYYDEFLKYLKLCDNIHFIPSNKTEREQVLKIYNSIFQTPFTIDKFHEAEQRFINFFKLFFNKV